MRNVPAIILAKRFLAKPQAAVGLLFTLVSALTLPVVLYLTLELKSDIERYDADAIRAKGASATATITRLEPIENVSVNGEHPTLISYEYAADGKMFQDKFQTLDSRRLDLQVGDKIPVTHYEGESVIADMESFSFPFYLFLFIPFTFLMVGLIFSLLFARPILRNFQLYKTGKVMDATIVTFVQNSGMRVTGRGQHVAVHYVYQDRSGHKIYSKSETTDFAILHEKKPGDAIKIFVSDDLQRSTIVPRIENEKYRWGIAW